MKPADITPITPIRQEQATEVNPTVPATGDLEAVAELADSGGARQPDGAQEIRPGDQTFAPQPSFCGRSYAR